MNGFAAAIRQIPMAAEFDGLAPKLFGKLNLKARARYRAGDQRRPGSRDPHIVVLRGGLGDAVAQLVLVSAVATMVSYAFSAAAEIKWLALDRGKVPVAHLARKMVVAVLALAFTVFAFCGGGVQEIYWLWMLIILGVPLYIFILWRRASHGEKIGGEVPAHLAPPPDQDVRT